MTSRKQALLVTYHNWSGKRRGGFHVLAEALCGGGYDVGFFSFPRRWCGALKRTERENAARLLAQLRGQSFYVRGARLTNFTAPTLGPPGPVKGLLGDRVSGWLDRIAVPTVAAACRRHVRDADVVMLESTAGVRWFPYFAKLYPRALFVYRPSDPLAGDPSTSPELKLAERALLERADVVLLVDECARAVYRREYPGLELSGEHRHILPNGVELSAFRTKHDAPAGFPRGPVALYLGAHAPDWEMLAATAKALPNVSVLAVCPEQPSPEQKRKFLSTFNAHYVPGVAPNEVPRYVTNADVVLVPYPREQPRLLTLGLTAKMVQAMAARKPLVAWHVNPDLRSYGVEVCSDEHSYVVAVKRAFTQPRPEYKVEWSDYSERAIQEAFLSIIRARTARTA
jgi:glycosyltransferase involved in cell wall biosynthesis